MLDLAFPHKEQLNSEWRKIIHNENFKYYMAAPWFDYELKLAESSWDSMQMVSIGAEGEVLGYFSASIDRAADKVSAIGAINFGDKNITFSMDFIKFLTDLFVIYRFRKIEWTVIVGNPAERMYDRIIEKYGGRIVGTSLRTIRLYDGNYYDLKSYEIFREDFLEREGK